MPLPRGQPGRLALLALAQALEPGSWRRVRADAYVRLLRRLLAEDPEAPDDLPRWLQPGAGGEAALRTLDLLNGARSPPRRRHWAADPGTSGLPSDPLLALRDRIAARR